jgi:predicted TIM-barrel fold metal-dependent hydrolase
MNGVVDSHAHIISPDPEEFPYAPATGELPAWLPERTVDAQLLLSRMESAGVEQAVLVQYASVHGFDNRYVLDTARRHPERFVAVCTLDGRLPSAPDDLNAVVQQGAAGLRLRAPGRQGPLDWLTCDPLWMRAADLDVPICVHFMPDAHAAGMPLLLDLLNRFPGVAVVLDHVGNPPWDNAAADLGLDLVLRLAEFPRVFIKFASVNLERLEHARVAPKTAIDRLVDAFGADRIMWGSDAPNTPGDYSDMLRRMRAAIAHLSEQDQEWILGGTARAAYPKLEFGKDTRRSTHAGLPVTERSR